MKTAILVDGGFYRKRAYSLWGNKTAEDRAKELQAYCTAHIKSQKSELYRVFYYDCEPIKGVVFHPLLKKNIDFILDPLWAVIKPNLSEHIDGIHSCWQPKSKK